VTERATGRHRASHKSASSPLATLTGPLSVVGDYVGTFRRSGVIIAMSSGLVASMALPAHAVGSVPAEVNGPQTASIPAVPAAPVGGSSAFFASPEGGLMSLPDGLALEDGTVSAPSAATLDFDQTTFVAVPTLGEAPDHPQSKVDLGLRGSRTGSTTRGDAAAVARTGAAARPAAPEAQAPTTRREARKATPASASKSSASSGSTTAASVATTASASGLGASAVAIASRYLGTPYLYGGHSPRGFDCSGLIQYVYAQLGHKLPRTAAQQAAAVKHIPRSQARPGDLVLFSGGGHIALYMGNGMMLDAPHTGTVVQIRKIYSTSVSFGRVA